MAGGSESGQIYLSTLSGKATSIQSFGYPDKLTAKDYCHTFSSATVKAEYGCHNHMRRAPATSGKNHEMSRIHDRQIKYLYLPLPDKAKCLTLTVASTLALNVKKHCTIDVFPSQVHVKGTGIAALQSGHAIRLEGSALAVGHTFSEPAGKRGNRSLMGASKDLATDTMTGVQNTCGVDDME